MAFVTIDIVHAMTGEKIGTNRVNLSKSKNFGFAPHKPQSDYEKHLPPRWDIYFVPLSLAMSGFRPITTRDQAEKICAALDALPNTQYLIDNWDGYQEDLATNKVYWTHRVNTVHQIIKQFRDTMLAVLDS